MKIKAIANPCAAAGRMGRQLERYERALAEIISPGQIEVTAGPGSARDLARRAMAGGVERLVVIGGDGTLNEVINGLADPLTSAWPADTPSVLYLPVGTGGDFARSIGARALSPEQILARCQWRRIDLGRAEVSGGAPGPAVHYFLNIASIGLSAEIAERANQASKRFGGRLAFFRATLAGLSSWHDCPVRLRIDGALDRTFELSAVVVANGGYFGGGMLIAPRARVDDGLLEVVVMKGIRLGTFIRHGRRVYAGTHLDLPHFERFSGRRIEVEPVEDDGRPLMVELDGEHPGFAPVRLGVLPQALSLGAPWTRAQALINPALEMIETNPSG